ncbi:MAG: hypothetical protein V5A20_04375 [Salinibacter sp.]|jgi:hypothetical protein|uniref:hypothetical protein n=1 Tax=Salinibacter sp. TaxID=2065818 RepID=UPI002FC373FE
MHRFLQHYTQLLLLPVLAIGLVLAGCDSSGSNGPGDDPGDTPTNAYPEGSSYGAEIVGNLLTSDLRSKIDGAPDTPVDEATLTALYTGDIDDRTIAAASNITTEGQSTYDDIAGGVDLSARLSDVSVPLVGSAALESDDSPTPGTQVTTDDLVRFYFQDVANNDRFTTPNGVHMGQLSEKLLASALYGEATQILTDFVEDPSAVANPAEKWDEAFGYYGAPRDFEESFLDLDNPDGLVDGSSSRDVDGSGGVDLTTEFVYTWAGYTAERAAASSSTGNLNDFAGRAFEGFREGRKAIEDGTLDDLSGPNGFAAQARDAWEATMAVNVIHYMNSLEADLEGLSDDRTLQDGDLGENAWAEAKAFTWALQFYSRSALDSSDLQTIHEAIGNDPPYGEKTVSEYANDLANATQLIANDYGFNATNVEQW